MQKSIFLRFMKLSQFISLLNKYKSLIFCGCKYNLQILVFEGLFYLKIQFERNVIVCISNLSKKV